MSPKLDSSSGLSYHINSGAAQWNNGITAEYDSAFPHKMRQEAHAGRFLIALCTAAWDYEDELFSPDEIEVNQFSIFF